MNATAATPTATSSKTSEPATAKAPRRDRLAAPQRWHDPAKTRTACPQFVQSVVIMSNPFGAS
jgi:hypothetical protein